MKKKIFTLTLLSCLAFILCTSVASAQSSPRRLALVIGNAGYHYTSPLGDATTNSANLVAETLQDIGFEVTIYHNLPLREMHRSIQEFENILSDNDTALFYFVGYGMNVQGKDYLIPINARADNLDDLIKSSIELNDIVYAMQAASTRILIMDASRDNRFNSSNTSDMSTPETSAEALQLEGTFLAFAAPEGEMVVDDITYAEALAKYMRLPNVDIDEVFRRVRNDVFVATSVTRGDGIVRQMIPETQSTIVGNFTLYPSVDGQSACVTCDITTSIVSPQHDDILSINHINMAVNLSQKPSGSVDWSVWLNEQPIAIDAVSLAPESFGTSQTYTLTLRLPERLADSSFELKAQAFDANNRAISDADTIQLSYIPAREPDLYLLAVGVDRYEDSRINDLSFAVEDAESFADLFRNQAGGLYRNVHIVTLTDEKATVANVQIALENLRAEVQENDVVLVFFAAHGDSKVSGQKEKYYIMLHDSNLDAYEISALPQQDITSFVQEVKGHTFMFIDTCHSGMSTVRNLPSPTDNLVRDFGVAAKTHTSGIDGRVIEIFAASQGSQPAQEQTRLGHGVFTQAIIQGIRDAEALDERRGVVTNSSLFDWIDYRVLELTNQYQKPHRDGSGGVFVLWQPPATAR